MPYQDCDCQQCATERRTPTSPTTRRTIELDDLLASLGTSDASYWEQDLISPEPEPQAVRFRCYECWQTQVVVPTELTNGHHLCPGCARNAVQCAHCDGMALNTVSSIDRTSLCTTCAENGSYYRCGQCNRYGERHRFTQVDGYHVCPTCIPSLSSCAVCTERTFRLYRMIGTDRNTQCCRTCATDMAHCSCCHCYTNDPDEDLTTLSNGNEVCATCLANNYRECRRCHRQHPRDYGCSYCNRDQREFVRSYSYKPRPKFHKATTETTKAFYGVEIEVDDTSFECAALVADSLGGLGYMKYDSSVSDGFEIVTHPMTHQYARESFPWEMLDKLAELGADASDSCGIHVHVSRDGFDSLSHQYRWLKLIYRNENGVTGIARRRRSSWARFTDSARDSALNVVKAKGKRSYTTNGSEVYIGNDRYEAVNIWNEKTFEVRVFASSLEPREVQAAIDLVAASVEYTRTLTVPTIIAGGWGWDAFRAWVAERPEYTALNEEMAICAS